MVATRGVGFPKGTQLENNNNMINTKQQLQFSAGGTSETWKSDILVSAEQKKLL